MEDGTLRQRRNLFLSGIILLIAKEGDIHSFENVNAGLISFHIGNASVVFEALWIGFLYFFIRFLQYLAEYEWDGLKHSFIGYVDEYTFRRIRAEMKSASYIGVEQDNTGASKLVWSWPFTFKIYALGYISQPENQHEIESTIRARVFAIPLLRGVLAWLFKSPHFTDLVLPILFSAFVIEHTGFSSWCGSLPNAFSG